ncbi:MAG: LysM peptidoglycan-binding domain-containing protein [Chloroflexi bacterium]|jgi:LysM repeat protein|nr:LysM peptidoglycan-binding domain-containing protein [Chloroflexota bacterium]
MKNNQTPTPASKSRNCPVCGTKLSENARRCLVCGADLSGSKEPSTSKPKKTNEKIDSKRIPEIKMNLIALIAIIVVILVLIGLLIFFIVTGGKTDAEGGVDTEATTTVTPTLTTTPSNTPTVTPLPTWTPLPPIEYTVKDNETCLDIALQFNTSVQSIILANNLNTSCLIAPGNVLQVPQPTLTPSPIPTATPEAFIADVEMCTQTDTIIVEANMTLSSIAANYNVSMSDIRIYNNLPNDIVRQGDRLIIPLCDRLPTAGPTLTPTPLPPYPAPNPLLPRSGAAFAATDEAVTLQWASVASLFPGEVYRVVVQDLTSAEEKILVDYVSDTKYILPASFRPIDTTPHIIQWSVSVARQINSDPNSPIYEEAGAISAFRVFSWVGSGVAPTATP